jgi:DNA topoisomerase-1
VKQLQHNGVIVPPRYQGKGLTVTVNGEAVRLYDEQEEMAISWARKVGTPYVEDPVFAKNFHADFSEKLGLVVKPGDVDFSKVVKIIDEERERKANLPKEEKKRLREDRKAQREANKEKYGWATVDGDRMEIGNFTVEPSSIFMGRGEHPMRGKWKEGPRHEDVELNLSPNAPRPPGNWKLITWEPDVMWIARWRDKLSGRMKYVWPSDSSHLKQMKDIEKFETAKKLRKKLRKVQKHITENLDAADIRRRKIATVCYLIDHCKFRVGDEKDDEEADTVGASTLRPEHIKFDEDNTVTFDFHGKDYVRHNICVKIPEKVVNNLKDFITNADSTLFNGVDSKRVSDFLDEVIPGLSSKVFRTYYASTTVESKLKKKKVNPDEPDYFKKHIATLANLEAAKVCNHKRTIPKSWENSLQRKKERLLNRKQKAREYTKQYRNRIRDQEKKYSQRLVTYEKKIREDEEKLKDYIAELREREEKGRVTKALKNRINSKKRSIKTRRERIKKLKKTHTERIRKIKQQREARKQRDQKVMEKIELQIEAQRETRDYNLNTSLKSYIDPRIYYDWGKRVDYDWKNYYPKTLRSKFSWVDESE